MHIVISVLAVLIANHLRFAGARQRRAGRPLSLSQLAELSKLSERRGDRAAG
jgi:hypothetical protein